MTSLWKIEWLWGSFGSAGVRGWQFSHRCCEGESLDGFVQLEEEDGVALKRNERGFQRHIAELPSASGGDNLISQSGHCGLRLVGESALAKAVILKMYVFGLIL